MKKTQRVILLSERTPAERNTPAHTVNTDRLLLPQAALERRAFGQLQATFQSSLCGEH